MDNDQDKRSLGGLFIYIREYIKYCFLTFTGLFKPTGNEYPEQDDPLPANDPHFDELTRSFSTELYAKLVMELPDHREHINDAYRSGDFPRLRHRVHQLLGCAAYCNAPELVTGLRQLRLALKTGDHKLIDLYFTRAVNVIDCTIKSSAYHRNLGDLS